MTIVADQSTTAAELCERATEVAKLAERDADAAEVAGRLTEAVVDALHDSGLWGLWVPRSLGGCELDVLPSLDVVERLTYGDPSVGWVLFATGLITATTAAYCGDEAVEQLFSGPRVPVIAGQGTRPHTAVAADGGYVLTGAWNFGSGMLHAQYTHNLAIVQGSTDARIFCTPVEDITMDLTSWDVLGLRATGSVDYAVDGVFVPESFTHQAAQMGSTRGGPLYGLGIIGFVTLGHAAWALGVSRRMLDELYAKVQANAGRPGTQADNDAFLDGIWKAESRHRSARALVHETWGTVSDMFARGDQLSMATQTLMRLSLSNATWSAHEVAQFVYAAAGTSGLRAGPLQKLLRDTHAGTQHITSGPGVRQKTGRALAGLADDKVWKFLDLADPA